VQAVKLKNRDIPIQEKEIGIKAEKLSTTSD
jgi:hypothetical protein